MSTWGYRIVRYHDRSAGYGLHEVHHNDQGRPVAMTAQGACFHADMEEGPAAIVMMLEKALKAAQEQPVMDEPAEWAK